MALGASVLVVSSCAGTSGVRNSSGSEGSGGSGAVTSSESTTNSSETSAACTPGRAAPKRLAWSASGNPALRARWQAAVKKVWSAPVLTETLRSNLDTAQIGTGGEIQLQVDRTTSLMWRPADAVWQAEVTAQARGSGADSNPIEATVRAIGGRSWFQIRDGHHEPGTWMYSRGWSPNVATGPATTGWETPTSRALRQADVLRVTRSEVRSDIYALRLEAADAIALLGYVHGKMAWEQLSKASGYVPARAEFPDDPVAAGFAISLHVDGAAQKLEGASEGMVAVIEATWANSIVHLSNDASFVVCPPAPSTVRTN